MNSIIQKPIGVTSFRHNMSEILKTARKEPVLLVERSNYQYVILDLNRYNTLVQKNPQHEQAQRQEEKKALFERLKKYGGFTLRVKKGFAKPPLTW